MTKEEIIETAVRTAKYNNFTGKVISFGDRNCFLWRDGSSFNAAMNHARLIKKNGQEPTIYVVDTTTEKPSCKTYSPKELMQEVEQAAQQPAGGGAQATEPAKKEVAKPNTADDAKAKAEEEAQKKAAIEARNQRITEGTATAEDYSDLTVAELKELCETKKIEIGKAKKKDELIALLLAPATEE